MNIAFKILLVPFIIAHTIFNVFSNEGCVHFLFEWSHVFATHSLPFDHFSNSLDFDMQWHHKILLENQKWNNSEEKERTKITNVHYIRCAKLLATLEQKRLPVKRNVQKKRKRKTIINRQY